MNMTRTTGALACLGCTDPSCGLDLRGHETQKNDGKDRGTDQVTQVWRHRHAVAASLAERGSNDLDEPEDQRRDGRETMP